MSIDVGARLRFVRARHGLSQRALAKRAGVTNSAISLIEANRVNPSVGALKRILDGVPIGMAEFFALEPEPERKAFFAANELTEIGRRATKGAISASRSANTKAIGWPIWKVGAKSSVASWRSTAAAIPRRPCPALTHQSPAVPSSTVRPSSAV